MRFVLDIDYPTEKMEANRRRMAARAAYQYVDRVPVGFCLVPRYFTPVFGIPYRAVFAGAEEQYHWQLQFLKYRIESIPEDMLCTGPTVHVAPYFDNVLDSAAFGAQIAWPEDETLHSLPVIRTVEQMERHPVPAPGTGLWGQARDWWQRMRELAQETRLTFRGQEGRVEVGLLGIGGLSPHMIAIDLVGHDFYWWQVEYPQACHAFLDRITAGLIEAQRYCMAIDDRPRGALGLAEDTAQIMSAAMFRQFCVPYASRLFAAFGPNGRGVHMCGQSAHLHQALVEDLHITSFDLFGYMVDPRVAAKNLGGRACLWGNINPMLMLDGTREQVKQAAQEALAALGPCGGFMLGDGANVCPGTPPANLAALTEASEEYGLPVVDPRPPAM
jgi:uroporphyrinogen-III decarboxylase